MNRTPTLKNPFMWLTRYIRTSIALRYISRRETHIDIGCGTARYLLERSPCVEKIGFDKQLGTLLEKVIPAPDKKADYITMLAVIEHLAFPADILRECHRVLKDDGLMIITTPKAKGLWLMHLYAPGSEKLEGEHRQHFDYQSMRALVADYFTISVYKTFELGYNQLFVCRKKIVA